MWGWHVFTWWRQLVWVINWPNFIEGGRVPGWLEDNSHHSTKSLLLVVGTKRTALMTLKEYWIFCGFFLLSLWLFSKFLLFIISSSKRINWVFKTRPNSYLQTGKETSLFGLCWFSWWKNPLPAAVLCGTMFPKVVGYVSGFGYPVPTYHLPDKVIENCQLGRASK